MAVGHLFNKYAISVLPASMSPINAILSDDSPALCAADAI